MVSLCLTDAPQRNMRKSLRTRRRRVIFPLYLFFTLALSVSIASAASEKTMDRPGNLIKENQQRAASDEVGRLFRMPITPDGTAVLSGEIGQQPIAIHNVEDANAGELVDSPINDAIAININRVSQNNKNNAGAGSLTKEQDPMDSLSIRGVGSALAASGRVDALHHMARTMATSAVNDQIGQWLNRYGTARIQLNTDRDFSLAESALDWLLPLYDSQTLTLFTQQGFRNKDRRNIANIGIGTRFIHHEWMMGGNAFYDNDFTGDNKRVGLGAELWTDSFQLSANGYFRLTAWHQSRDRSDYNERPANGVDLRANGWLPAQPHLGGSLIYEHYFGDNVALFGKDHLQRNPYAITLGGSYTPFSLLTLEVKQRLGKQGNQDTQLGLHINYRLGADLPAQLDPAALVAARTIAKTRYDLVERNHNIVLQYQEQQRLKIKSTEYLEGYPGNSSEIYAEVVSKYGVRNLQWMNVAAFVAAGGQIMELPNNRLKITYPPYNDNGDNRYHIDVMAYDTRGQSSNISTTQISVLKPEMDNDAWILNGNLTLIRDNAKADGVDKNQVRARVTNAAGTPLSHQRVVFSADNGATLTAVQVTTGEDGVAETSLSSTTVGVSNVSATLSNNRQSALDTHFVPNDRFTAVLVNGARFDASAGFPTTGFANAKFLLEINGDSAQNADYEWRSSAPAWVTVDSGGNVQFQAEPTARQTVTITARSKRYGHEVSYPFTVSRWFISNGINHISSADADAYCAGNSGYEVPSYRWVTNAVNDGDKGVRAVGSLWSEWGNIANLNLMFGVDQSWSAEYTDETRTVRYTAGLSTGHLTADPIVNNGWPVLRMANCVKTL
ncbi:inverse autotransporter beta domain-containing protein [Edwardsiella piscicida]|uniref:inverse autotransporter beta domain-containing protein n=2 Tax=Edwardsiella piscicida TaxID=1263550 RepID=UPI00290CA080|nr:inverse autotransporter beta domain-containing protein [Edwardsiella piscicida]